MPQSAQNQPPSGDADGLFRFAWSFFFDGHRAAVTLPIRTSEGVRGIGLHGLFAVGVTLGWAALYPCPPLYCYAAFLFALLFVKRTCSLCRHHFGIRQISHYPGYPALALLLVPFASEGFAKAVLEPLLVAAAGMVARDYSPGVGQFLLTGAAFSAYRGVKEAAMTAAGDMAEADARTLAQQRAARQQRKGWMD